MGKKKNKIKFIPADVNNLPSSSTKNVKKTSNVVNTSRQLSVTSKANESIDSISTQSDDKMSNKSENDITYVTVRHFINKSKNDIRDDSFESLRNTDDEHKASESVAFPRDNITRRDTNEEESTKFINTVQHSDEVINKLQHVTIDSHNAMKSYSSEKKNWDDVPKTKPYYPDGGNKYNYTKKNSHNLYKNDRPNQRDHYNQKNQNKSDPTYVTVRHFINKSKNDIRDDSFEPLRNTDDDHKASESVASRDNITRCNTNEEESTKCINTGQHSDEVTNKLQQVTIDSQNAMKSDSSDHTEKKSCDDVPKAKPYYHDGGNKYTNTKRNSNDFYKDDRPNYYNQKNQNRYGSTYVNDKHFTNKSSNNFYKSDRPNQHYNHRDQSKYDGNKPYEYRNRNSNVRPRVSSENLPWQAKQELGRNDEIEIEAKYRNSASGTWEERPSEEIPSIRNNTVTKGSFEQNEQENWDESSQNEQGTFVENETTIKEGSSSWDDTTWDNNSSSKDNSAWDNSSSKDNSSLKDDSAWDNEAAGTELNAHAETFVPILSGLEKAEIAKDEARLTGDDYYSNKYRNKPEWQQRASWRGSENKRNYHSEELKTKEASHPKRHSEGNWDKQEYSRQNRYSFDRSSEKVDVEYRKFQEEERNSDKVEFLRVGEVQQDLFAVAKDYSLAHCVAEDLRMGSGIAVSFKRDFKDLDVLLNQRQKQGGLAVLEITTDEGVRYIYYLVTKRVSNGKPTYETLWSSLKKMRDHIRQQDVRKLAIPRLGCGLDRLEWTTVKHMIEFLFRDVEVEITVCNFQQTEDSPEKPFNTQSCKVVNVKKSIADIEEETTIIYLSTGDGHVSTEMEQLSKKFSFLDEFKRARKQPGDLIKYEVPKKYYVLYGCIVRKTEKDPFDFVSFRKCVAQIDRNSKKDGYFYVGIQAIKDDNDDLINDKLVTILRNYLHKMELYVCWDGDLVGQMPIPPPSVGIF